MMRRAVLIAALCCACSATLAAAAQGGKVDADGFPVAQHTYFRTQDMMITNDATKEDVITGLSVPDVKLVQRATPNLENLAPMLTMLAPLLPVLKPMSDALGIFFPNAWDLATTGPQGDWLRIATATTLSAFLGRGPRPLITPTVLIASPEAYSKLRGDLQAYSGLKTDNTTDPFKRASVTKAIVTQLARNMFVPAADATLGKAPNGTQLVTYGDVLLTLVVKEDGSRWLVSNTTSAKLVQADVKCGGLTLQVVDNFIVPAMAAKAPKPKPLITQEDIDRLPEVLKMYQDSWRQLPLALHSMPKNLQVMLVRQLPDKQQQQVNALLKKVEAVMPRISLPGAGASGN